ncbi:DUF2066 domain-containing protein [Nitrincola sp.]|uniref:DUF2066 domain-containing protein n=1 Tax=Nitrincola sp. TaxID=1926584 RepID=UPI003A955A35
MTKHKSSRLKWKQTLAILLLLLPLKGIAAESMLVWLAEEQAGVRDFATTSHPLIRGLRTSAPSSLAVLSPLMDLADQQSLSVDALWRGADEAVLSASMRYAADTVVVGRVDAGGTEPFTEWVVWQDGERQLLSTQGDWQVQVDELLASLSASSTSAPSVAADPNAIVAPLSLPGQMTPPGYLVTVYRLNQAGDYLQVMDLFTERLGAQAVIPVSFNAGTLRVSIDYEGAVSALQRDLLRGSQLTELPDGQLEFVWN